MKPKVYCKGCKYNSGGRNIPNGVYCEKKIGEEDTPCERKEIFAMPCNENQHNRCIYYESKGEIK